MKYCPMCATPLARRRLDETERLACSAPHCQFVYWDNPVPVVAALVQHGDQIILARNAQWPGPIFSLITGYLERDETPEQAVLREVQEELGLQGQIKSFIGHYSVFKKNQLILAYWIRAEGELEVGKEIAEVRFVTEAELKRYEFGDLKITAQIVSDGLLKMNIQQGAYSPDR